MIDHHREKTMTAEARIAVVKDSVRQEIEKARAALGGRVADILIQYTDGSGAQEVVRAAQDVMAEASESQTDVLSVGSLRMVLAALLEKICCVNKPVVTPQVTT